MDIAKAYAPYLIIIAVFSIAQFPAVKTFLAKGLYQFQWPGLDIVKPDGSTPTAVMFLFGWASAAGTLLLVAGILTMAVLGMRPATAAT